MKRREMSERQTLALRLEIMMMGSKTRVSPLAALRTIRLTSHIMADVPYCSFRELDEEWVDNLLKLSNTPSS